jgi:hypothetical protein
MSLVLSEEERLMLRVAAHHAVADAWSEWVLMGELMAAHDVFAAEREPSLSATPALIAHLSWGLRQAQAQARAHGARSRQAPGYLGAAAPNAVLRGRR